MLKLGNTYSKRRGFSVPDLAHTPFLTSHVKEICLLPSAQYYNNTAELEAEQLCASTKKQDVYRQIFKGCSRLPAIFVVSENCHIVHAEELKEQCQYSFPGTFSEFNLPLPP